LVVPLLDPWRERGQSRWRVGRLLLMLIVVCCVVVFCVVLAYIFCVAPERTWQKGEHDRSSWSVENLLFLSCVPEFWIYLLWFMVYVIRLHTTTTCRQLGNDTTYDTEKKNPTSHDVADTSAVSGWRVGKTRHHVVKTNCGRHLKRRHFQLSPFCWCSCGLSAYRWYLHQLTLSLLHYRHLASSERRHPPKIYRVYLNA
jgi:hypothetical protein